MKSTSGPEERISGQRGAYTARPASQLVGRETERAFLREELAAALAGHGRLVLLGGEAGIGKTSLVRDLSREAELAGVRVISGYCFDLTNTPPYGPWLEIFRRIRPDSTLPAAPEPFADGLLGSVVDQSALFADVYRFMSELCALTPVFLLLEDLHWSDPASIELLRHIAPLIGQLPLLVVVTYRDDELTRHHPLFQHLPALIREGGGARLEPRTLDAFAIRELVRARFQLTDCDESRLVTYLERHAEGNPFFGVELLRALEEEGLLRVGDGRSALGELARIVVPTLLHQVIESRILRLGEEVRQILEIAAVIGQEVPIALMQKMSGLEEEALLWNVERLIDAHLMEASRNGTRIRFVHALTRSAIYEAISPPRRRLMHRQVGETLASQPGSDPDEVAVHFQQADDSRAWEWLELAGDRAQRAYAWLTAAERLLAAAELLRNAHDQEEKYCRLMVRVGYLLRFSDASRSIAALREVERLASRLGDDSLAAEAGHARGFHLCYSDQFRAGVAEMKKYISVLEEFPPNVAHASTSIRYWFAGVIPATSGEELNEDEILVQKLHAEGFHFRRWIQYWHTAITGDPSASIEQGNRFVGVVAEVPKARGGVRVAVAFAQHGLGIAFAAAGRPSEARAEWNQSRIVFGEVDHFAVTAFTLLNELRDVAMTYLADSPDERRRLASEAETSLARAAGALRPGVSPRLAWLGCLEYDGLWNEAFDIILNYESPGNSYLRREITATKITIWSCRGERDLAWNEILTLLESGPDTAPGNSIFQEGLLLQRTAACMSLDAGDLFASRKWLEANDRWLSWSGSVLGRAANALCWATWHRANLDSVSARGDAERALYLATGPHQPMVQIGAHRLLGELDTSGQMYDSAEFHLEQSMALCETCGVPFERALTQLSFAELHLARCQAEQAVLHLEDAIGTLDRLGAVPARARAELIRERLTAMARVERLPAGLTKREMEILRLIGRHQTDKEIAETLFISHLTVSTHVKRILSKLGVANRREAAEYANRSELA